VFSGGKQAEERNDAKKNKTGPISLSVQLAIALEQLLSFRVGDPFRLGLSSQFASFCGLASRYPGGNLLPLNPSHPVVASLVLVAVLVFR
jgi:hypothetical protein